MRRKYISIMMSIIVGIVAICCLSMNVYASDSENNEARGVYLAQGTSSISKKSTYTINATGDTTAAKRCTVSVLVTVEQFRNDQWYYYTSWQTTNENAFSASISNTIYVDLGYFYRVVSTHRAGTDGSSSFTNAIWMGL